MATLTLKKGGKMLKHLNSGDPFAIAYIIEETPIRAWGLWVADVPAFIHLFTHYGHRRSRRGSELLKRIERDHQDQPLYAAPSLPESVRFFERGWILDPSGLYVRDWGRLWDPGL